MRTNPLLKGKTNSALPYERNPLENPSVAREWARHARAKGLNECADAWERKAIELDSARPVDWKMRAAGDTAS